MIRCVAVVVCLCSVACKKERTTETEKPDPPAPVVDDSLFIVAKPRIETMGMPARFTGLLPTTVEQLERGEHPPKPFIAAALAANTYEMRARMLAALAKASERGAIPDRVAGFYSGVVGYSAPEETCKWLVDSAIGKLPQPAKEVLWRAASRCRYTSLAPAFAKEDVPDEVVVEWYFGGLLGEDVELPYSDRVARAAAAYARAADNDFKLRQVGFVFARMKGDQSIAALTTLQKSLPEPKRSWVALGMLRSSSAAGKAIGQRACKHPKLADDTMCKPHDYDRPSAAPTDLAGLLEQGGEMKAVLAKHPREAVVKALTECVQSARDYRRLRCMNQLVEIDRAAAVAAGKQAAAAEPRIAMLVRSLEKFPSVAAVDSELTRLGFKLDKPRSGEEQRVESPVTVEDVLFGRGRTHWFDAETGMFPNEHDELLAELAALTAPALDGVVFEEIPPSEADDDRGAGNYLLRAYLGGKRYTLEAENHGDWYDVEAVIGLVNALLVAKKSDVRLAVLPTGDQTVKVLAGPSSGIHSLVDSKLIEVGQASDAERAGKEFEDRVFDSIRGDAGGEVQRDVRIKMPEK
jgi:hypothetical protein